MESVLSLFIRIIFFDMKQGCMVDTVYISHDKIIYLTMFLLTSIQITWFWCKVPWNEYPLRCYNVAAPISLVYDVFSLEYMCRLKLSSSMFGMSTGFPNVDFPAYLRGAVGSIPNMVPQRVSPIIGVHRSEVAGISLKRRKSHFPQWQTYDNRCLCEAVLFLCTCIHTGTVDNQIVTVTVLK